jgi:tRNA (guanine-N(7)-)-methyltransferase subunit TRM82
MSRDTFKLFFPFSHEQTQYTQRMRQPVQRLCGDADTLYFASGSIIKAYKPADGSCKEIWRGGDLTDAEKLKSITTRAIIALAAQNGVLASVGEDKMLRVFDLKTGTLESSRETTKRPSCVVFANDNQILVGDKFGDAYMFDAHDEDSHFKTRVNLSKTNAQKKADKRARIAKLQAEQAKPSLDAKQDENEGEDEEEPVKDSAGRTHLPILGHVSILTDMVVAGDRVITADRDEHVRVSHFPKSYIIEHFLLAHKSFVTSLLLVDDKLISGGGDDFLAVWDWRQGKLQGQISLQEPMRLAGCISSAVAKLLHVQDSLILHLEGISGVYVLPLQSDLTKSSGWRSIGNRVYYDLAIVQDVIYCSCAEGSPFEAFKLDGVSLGIETLNEAANIEVDALDFNIPSREDMRKRATYGNLDADKGSVTNGKRKPEDDLNSDEKRAR